ncbi:MAG: sarcosine oxidase subunit delta [Proteobacteria bacterium]|nr:sarcosine oxidase subunit delta [Pseudomonadota bacterium]
MLLIECPHCGPREQTEFTCGGEGHIVRPDPATATDAEWGHYLFMRKNPKGLHYERWFHAHGCRQWFHAARSTVTHEIFAIYGIDEPPPAIDANKAGSR